MSHKNHPHSRPRRRTNEWGVADVHNYNKDYRKDLERLREEEQEEDDEEQTGRYERKLSPDAHQDTIKLFRERGSRGVPV